MEVIGHLIAAKVMLEMQYISISKAIIHLVCVKAQIIVKDGDAVSERSSSK